MEPQGRGLRVEEVECTTIASELLKSALADEGHDGKQLVLHADSGGPMKGATMKATMEKLGVVSAFSRPRVSDDNAFSEALFRTAKYWVEYPRKPLLRSKKRAGGLRSSWTGTTTTTCTAASAS